MKIRAAAASSPLSDRGGIPAVRVAAQIAPNRGVLISRLPLPFEKFAQNRPVSNPGLTGRPRGESCSPHDITRSII